MKSFRIVLAVCLFCCANAAVADGLKQEEIANVKKLAVRTVPIGEEARLFDKRGFMEKNMGLAMDLSGFAPLELTGAIYDEKQYWDNKKALGGSPKTYGEMLEGFPIAKVFDSAFCEEFGIAIETICPKQIEELGLEFPPVHRGRGIVPSNARRDYKILKSKISADMVFEIRYVYGIATYGKGSKPVVVISGKVSAIETGKNKFLKVKNLCSDEVYGQGYTIDELVQGGQKLFYNEVCNAIKGFCQLIVTEFELPAESSQIE